MVCKCPHVNTDEFCGGSFGQLWWRLALSECFLAIIVIIIIIIIIIIIMIIITGILHSKCAYC